MRIGQHAKLTPSIPSYLPSSADLNAFCKVITEEVRAAGTDAELAMAVTKGSSKTITLFAIKAERLLVLDKASTQINLGVVAMNNVSNVSAGTRSLAAAAGGGAGRNAAQVHNVSILSLVVRLYRFVSALPKETTAQNTSTTNYAIDDKYESIVEQKRNALTGALDDLHKLSDLILGTYLGAASEAMGQILARVHRENFSGTGQTERFVKKSEIVEGDKSSNYMTAFEEALLVLKQEHLNKLPTGHDIVDKMLLRFQARITSLYVRHVSMVRPLDSRGRSQLFYDMSQFETVISRGVHECGLSDLAEVYTEFKAMQELLLYNPTESVPRNDYKRFLEQVKLSTLLNFIFSTAPPELRSPYDQLKMSPERFSSWMDKAECGHLPEGTEVLDLGVKKESSLDAAVASLVRSELDMYVQRKSVKNVNTDAERQDGFSPEYNILTALLDN